ncbi:MAG: hypothetical protein HYX90_08460 [Chloroflexi bacterium]|nr:hypothetical protein [Chloroflexota bacterium]
MSFFRSSRGPKKTASSSRKSPGKASFNKELLGFDLVYQISYLSAVSAAGIPRHQIFQLASRLDCCTAPYFGEIDRLSRGMNYQYAEACRIVGETAKEREIQSLLLRLSSCLQTGEPEMAFMEQEAKIQTESYGNRYEGGVESLKKWADAYVALMVSVALIIVVAAVSTVIYNTGTGFVMGLIVVMVAVSAMGSWIIYRTAPREVKVLPNRGGQRWPHLMFMLMVPGALAAGSILFLAGAAYGTVIAVVGAMLVPVGVAALSFDSGVSKRDAELGTFLRTLGSTGSAIGTTPTEALGRLDLRSIGSLSVAVKRLHIRLKARVTPELCWHRFVLETGSELARRCSRIFLDGTGLGGDSGEVGARTSVLARQVNYNRERRQLVSSTFGYLTLIVHAALSFLLVFSIEVVHGFGKIVSEAGIGIQSAGQLSAVTGALSFDFKNLQFLKDMMVPVVVVLSLVNAFTAKVVDGGHPYKVFFYLGLTLLSSGLALIAAPILTSMIFNMNPMK